MIGFIKAFVLALALYFVSPQAPCPSHVNLQKPFPAFGILSEGKTQGSHSFGARYSFL